LYLLIKALINIGRTVDLCVITLTIYWKSSALKKRYSIVSERWWWTFTYSTWG